MTVTPRQSTGRAAPLLVLVLLAAIGLLGVTGRGDATRPDGRRPSHGTAVAVVLPVAVVAGDMRFPQDSLTRSGRDAPSAATVGVDSLAPEAPSGRSYGWWHRSPRAAAADLAAPGAGMWRSRAPPHMGIHVTHA